MDADPGTRWVYNSGGSHLMSGIVKSATGKFVTEYAKAELFDPLGIEAYHWKLTPGGYPDTEGGLYLEAEDLAKIGYLYLNDGVWDGARILPEGWVEVSTSRIVDDIAPGNPNRDSGYGYQWWRIDLGGVDIWAGLGYGGQTLLVLPEYDLVGVANSWNVFGPERSVIGAFAEALIESVEAGGTD
jgi:CubicO group peptidase (beta-lactamase class C family)